MKCQKCGGRLKVIDTVHTDENEIYRKRKCIDCEHTIYTAEYMIFPNAEFMDEWHAAYRKKEQTAEQKAKALERRVNVVKRREPRRSVMDIKHARWQISTNPDGYKDLGTAKCSSCGEIVRIGRIALPRMCPGCEAIMS